MDEKRGTGAPRATDTKHKKKKGQAKELKNFYRFQVIRFFVSFHLLFFTVLTVPLLQYGDAADLASLFSTVLTVPLCNTVASLFLGAGGKAAEVGGPAATVRGGQGQGAGHEGRPQVQPVLVLGA